MAGFSQNPRPINLDAADIKPTNFFFFFCNIGSFDPLCVRSPLDTLESGVLFHIMVVETVTCFTRRSTMESSVVSSLPDCTFNPAERRCGGNNQLWNTLATMGGRPSCESYCWLFTISSPTFGRIGHWWNAVLALDEPFFGMPTRIRVLGRTS